MRAAWLTDIHLDGVPSATLEAFHNSLLEADPDIVLVGGDIGMAATFPSHLETMQAKLQRPIYFVLGNHDFYGGSIAKVRRQAAELSERSPNIRWLPKAGVVGLTDQTGLVGHGSWADGRLGNTVRSTVLLNDYVRIRDFIPLAQLPRFEKLGELGDEAAAFFESVLAQAAERFSQVIVLTHVPPFKEAAWHEGRTSDDDWLPHFACKAVGDVLVRVMQAHPECRATVLCGHTHGEGEARITENLLVRTGPATYGKPTLQSVLELP